jgi:hypothetical protein
MMSSGTLEASFKAGAYVSKANNCCQMQLQKHLGCKAITIIGKARSSIQSSNYSVSIV